jgi:hypothetical protein
MLVVIPHFPSIRLQTPSLRGNYDIVLILLRLLVRPSLLSKRHIPLYRFRRINHLVGNNLHSQYRIPRTVDTFWNSKAVIV